MCREKEGFSEQAGDGPRCLSGCPISLVCPGPLPLPLPGDTCGSILPVICGRTSSSSDFGPTDPHPRPRLRHCCAATSLLPGTLTIWQNRLADTPGTG